MAKTLQSLTLLKYCSNTHNHPKQESEDEQEELSGNFKIEQLYLHAFKLKPTLYSCEPGLLAVMKTLSIVMNTLLIAKQGTSLENKWHIEM